MRLCSTAAAIVVTVSPLVSCSDGTRLPDSLSFQGQRVERAAEWEMGSLRGVVLVPPGEDLDSASLQIGIILGDGPYDADELHRWVMKHYHAAPVDAWYETWIPPGPGACKIGRDLQSGRLFAAIHICRSGPAGTSSVEADALLEESVVQRCRREGEYCWRRFCAERHDEWLAALEALAKDVVSPKASEEATNRRRGVRPRDEERTPPSTAAAGRRGCGAPPRPASAPGRATATASAWRVSRRPRVANRSRDGDFSGQPTLPRLEPSSAAERSKP